MSMVTSGNGSCDFDAWSGGWVCEGGGGGESGGYFDPVDYSGGNEPTDYGNYEDDGSTTEDAGLEIEISGVNTGPDWEPTDSPSDSQTEPTGNGPCVFGPIIRCTLPIPPTMPFQEPDPFRPEQQPKPWTWCNTLGIFCSSPADPPRSGGVSVDEKKAECFATYEREDDECKAYSKAVGTRSFKACQERAVANYRDCLTNAARN